MSISEIMMQMRLQNIGNLGEVEAAYLETAGTVSVIRFSENKIKKGMSTLPKVSELGGDI